ncbi:DUF397 domain-containing protein [Streptomyces sp. NPDC050617]|uniref:DUF397 domain-containing protein n=1 Tax=Streptomyces sp. NPDC050617 TaxID=3154628 RepID=UPI0034239AD8
MALFEFVKSSYSTVNGECVEVATNLSHTVAVRDSKDAAGPVLRFEPAAWASFRQAVVGGGFCSD